MNRIISRVEIESVLPSLDLLNMIEAGFVAYSKDQSVVPPVGELLLPNGEVHIKYGYLKADEYYVIKIASGFPANSAMGKAPCNGMMLLFNQNDGEPVAMLLDEGLLTDIRTAAAGAIVARHMAPKNITRIGILGTGVQARLQLEHLKSVTDCRDVTVYGRNEEQLTRYQSDMGRHGFSVVTTQDPAIVAQTCNVIVTTTASQQPLLLPTDIRPGTHITAMGSDTPHKQELHSAVLAQADVIVADSISQCMERGEIYKALSDNKIETGDIVELGAVISGSSAGRLNDNQITVADLTGVAVQDIQIAKAVYQAVMKL